MSATAYRLENTNPCRAIRPNRRKHCERFLSLEELTRLGDQLTALRAKDETLRNGGVASTLLLLTGCRYREIFKRASLGLPLSRRR